MGEKHRYRPTANPVGQAPGERPHSHLRQNSRDKPVPYALTQRGIAVVGVNLDLAHEAAHTLLGIG